MRGLQLRPIVVVALTVLAAIAVIGGALGVRPVAGAATVNDPGSAASAAVDAGETAPVLAAPERAVPVDQDLPTVVARTGALVVLLGTLLLLRRQPVPASAVGSPWPPASVGRSTARPLLLPATPGPLRV